MVEKADIFTSDIPCMADHRKACVNCKLYSTNLENLRRLVRIGKFKSFFSYYVGEFPSVQQISELLFGFEDKYPVINTQTFGLIPIPRKLISFGKIFAQLRSEYINRFNIFDRDNFAFDVHCPNMKSVLK